MRNFQPITADEIRRALDGSASNAQQLVVKSTRQEKPMAGRRGKRSSDESLALIKKFILEAEKPVTLLQICDSINRRPSPAFRAMINGLVASGEVVKFDDVGSGGNLQRFWYWHP